MRRPGATRRLRRLLIILVVVVAACADDQGSLAGFESADIDVDGTSLTVALAETSSQRNQGLRNVGGLPESLDGMLFTWDVPIAATFGMGDVLFPLDIWWFDEDGHLLGSTEMSTCPDGDCVGYRAPGPVLWALETPAGEYDFRPGARISNVEKP